MFTIEGGIKVYGETQQNWHTHKICLSKTLFDPKAAEPKYDTNKCSFILPAFNGQSDYALHLLENGDALIMKNGKMYLCTRHQGKPVVFGYLRTNPSVGGTQPLQVVA